MGRPTGSQGVKGYAYRVLGLQGVGLQGPRGSRGGPTKSKEVKGIVQGPRGSTGRFGWSSDDLEGIYAYK